MKKISAIFLLCLGFAVFAATRAHADSGFEGAIVMRVTLGGRPPMDMTFYYKGNKIRTESTMGGRAMVTILDNDSNTTTHLMPERKMYMVQKLPPEHNIPQQPAQSNDKPVKTGKSETIQGYTCDEWTWTDGTKSTTDIWCARGLMFEPPTMNGGSRMGPQSKFASLFKENGFPVRQVVTDSTGKEVSRSEVVKIEKKTLADTLFTPPADYKPMSMPNGMMHRGPMGMPPNGAPGAPPASGTNDH